MLLPVPVGAVIANDPWQGAVVDCGVSDDAGWGPVAELPASGGWYPTGVPMALQVPYVTASGSINDRLPIKALSVSPLSPGADGSSRWCGRKAWTWF